MHDTPKVDIRLCGQGLHITATATTQVGAEELARIAKDYFDREATFDVGKPRIIAFKGAETVIRHATVRVDTGGIQLPQKRFLNC